jgi:histidinol phosphatase-like enzyme
MILQAARELGLDLAASWTIGDGARDVEAGLAAGTRAILISADDPAPRDDRSVLRAKDLLDAARIVATRDE